VVELYLFLCWSKIYTYSLQQQKAELQRPDFVHCFFWTISGLRYTIQSIKKLNPVLHFDPEITLHTLIQKRCIQSTKAWISMATAKKLTS